MKENQLLGDSVPLKNPAGKEAKFPCWARKNIALEKFPVGWRRLEAWRLEGFIRSTKLKDSRTGTRLYFLPDIQDLLLKLSSGHKPHVKLGRHVS
ncbi:MAG: hypothetical protein WCP55_10000 [Lentisphaerota bacterium]